LSQQQEIEIMSTKLNYISKTERLRLREFTLYDTKFIIDLLNSPGWLQFIGDKNVKTKEQAESYLKNGPLKSYEQNGFGLSMVETKEGIPIGMCGIIRRENLEYPDIGFALLPEFTLQGYGYEIASEVVKYAKDNLKLPTILAITLPDNLKSIKLLEKIGFTFVKSIPAQSSDEELLLYSH
jgi:RimJ/RimL family protein N-acetyltransferase